ncbi:MAG: carboxypeptidase-like regulatory domain-containing protein [Kofleriaceae bacterium]
MTTRLLTASVVAALAALALASVAAPPAQAQPAAAIGKPLPDGQARDGTVMVRVIAGSPSSPVPGVEVALTLTRPDGQGEPEVMTATTDAEGRATFSDVAMGLQVKASTAGEPDAPSASVTFPMPQSGGVRLMISTKVVAGAGGASAGPMMGGAGGPPMSPRKMSGQARPEPADARDAITVRVSYDDFADPTPLAGIPVALVAYRHDLQVGGLIVQTDAAGRASFSGLDKRAATSYFAMTLLPRGGDFDRLTSMPILLDGEGGMRLMLSGEKRASTAPPVDDLAKLDEQPVSRPIPPGVVRVQVAGVPELSQTLELVDVLTGQVVQTAPLGPPLAALDAVTSTFTAPIADPALSKGALAVVVVRDGQPVPGATVTATPAGPTVAPVSATTDATGAVNLVGLPPGATVDLTIAPGVDADWVERTSVTLPGASGARVSATLTWAERGEAGGRFSGVPAGGEHAYAVRLASHGQSYLSAPFQLPPTRGAAITVLVMPRVMFQFSLSSFLDDVYLAVRGQFGIRNASWAPYLTGTDARPEELTLPLPAGFTGAIVRDDFQQVVGVDPAKGFVIRRPIPPGGYQFVGAFSLKVDRGTVKWSLPLPLGTFDSGIEIQRAGDSRVVLPSGVKLTVEEATDTRGRFHVMSPITILPKQTMVFEVRDLPHEAGWRVYGRRFAGVAVLLMLGFGTFLALWRPKPAQLPTARFDALLDELAALEAAGSADAARKAKLMDELEALYRKQPPG